MNSWKISAKNNVSLSTIRRIVATFDECRDMTGLFKSRRLKRSINYHEFQRWIKEFVDNTSEGFTSNDVFFLSLRKIKYQYSTSSDQEES